jgi:hypothetical protein
MQRCRTSRAWTALLAPRRSERGARGSALLCAPAAGTPCQRDRAQNACVTSHLPLPSLSLSARAAISFRRATDTAALWDAQLCDSTAPLTHLRYDTRNAAVLRARRRDPAPRERAQNPGMTPHFATGRFSLPLSAANGAKCYGFTRTSARARRASLRWEAARETKTTPSGNTGKDAHDSTESRPRMIGAATKRWLSESTIRSSRTRSEAKQNASARRGAKCRGAPATGAPQYSR